MANINNELNQIKNAVYGKEVRGSIHDGIDKINKETEIATGKADQAHDVMESIIQDGFDNAALEANFEQKLDDKIANLQPEWTQFKEDTTSQLAESFEYTESSLGYLYSRKHGKRIIGSIIVDDGAISDYTKLKPIVEEKSIPLGLGIVTSWMDTPGFMSTPQIKEMVELGCEVLAHSHKHKDFATLTKEEQIEEFRLSKSILRSKGFNPRLFVYPFNSTDNNSREVLPSYYEGGFAKVGWGNGGVEGLNTPNFRNVEIGRNALGSYFDKQRDGFPEDTSSLEYYKAVADDSKQSVNWLVWVLHSEPMDDTQLQYFIDTVDYMRSIGIEIVSPSKGMEIYGNIIEIDGKGGNFYINADASLKTNQIPVQTLPINSRKISDTIFDFEMGKITVVPISNNFAQQNGFPGSSGGELETHRLTSEYYHNFQIYRRTMGAHETYIRFADSSYKFGEFENLSRVFYRVEEGINNFSANTKPSLFPFRRTTKFAVDTNGATGFPGNKPGIVTVDRVGDQLAYTKQYFVPNEGVEMWVRSGRNDDTWTTFVKIGP